jgi:hypothetical protein
MTVTKECYIIQKDAMDVVLKAWKDKVARVYHRRDKDRYNAYIAALSGVLRHSPVMPVEFEQDPAFTPAPVEDLIAETTAEEAEEAEVPTLMPEDPPPPVPEPAVEHAQQEAVQVDRMAKAAGMIPAEKPGFVRPRRRS